MRKCLLLSLVLLHAVLFVAAQTRHVSGIVIDAQNNQPLTGVTIQIQNQKTSSLTGSDGRFTIATPQGRVTLIFSYVGFGTKNLTVEPGQTNLSVPMEASVGQMNEVVVTALGISKKQKAIGYATSTIKAEDLVQTGSPNFASALYGKAPGVRIAAAPGGATSAVNIQIRGVNSITGKNQPLIVLDGMPIRNEEVNNGNYWGDQRLRGNGLLDINPEDIDNVSILKGASAAALYGSEAVNGVVLITTKNGAKSKKGFSVDVNTNYSVDKVAFLPKYQHVRGAGAPLNVNNAGQDDAGFIYYDVDGDGVKETRGILNFSINFGPKFDGKPTMAWDGVIRPYSDQGDNYAGLFQTAHNHNINVALSQSSENSSTRFSLTRQQNQGVSLGAENSKNIANLNSSFKLGKKFTTDLLVNFINQEVKNRPYSIDRMMNNFTGMMGRFDNADWYLSKYKTSKGYRFVTGSNQSLTPDENIKYNGFKSDIADYVWRVKEHNESEKSNRVIANLTNTWQIIDALKLRARVATDFTSQKTESKKSTEVPLSIGNSGSFGLAQYQNSIIYGDVLLTYTKEITPDIDVNVMGGYTATKETGTSTLLETKDGLSVENWFDLAASVDKVTYDPTNRSFNYRNELVKDAFIGTINGSYKSYLFLEGTLRRDRTSTMNPNNNSFVYPSVNSSFVFTEAFNLPSFINFGKLRASWGIVGNYPDIYRANIAYDQNTLGVQAVGGKPVLYTTLPANFGNDAIRPEEKHEIEFGLETKFLNNRLGLDVSYYNGQIRDQILPLTIPASSGATTVLTNIGTLRNKGIEVGITGAPVSNSNFRWDAGVNFSMNRNVVEKLASGSDELLHQDYDGNAATLVSKVGQPMGDFYAHPIATNSKGEKIVDPNGLYKVDPDKMVKVGNAMPKMVGGVFNTFTYKGISLDALVDFRFGGHIMPTGINWMISRGLLEESLNYMDAEHGGLSYYVDANGKGVQTTAAQGPNGEKVYHDGMLLEGATADGQKNTNVTSQANYYWTVYNWGGPQYSPNTRYELYIQKNSYVKFREISLGYKIPARLVSKIGAKNVQLSVFGRNLFYIYRTLKNLDAEQTTAGSRWFQTLNNAGTNPSTRSFGVMLRAGF
ncbi:SusC/RagA family TonB-linked outer membrane protein [Chitinophagaceae bacterium LB-8]|uniref:SusC/RagA family TonB-linked outer membrane protein n=1 Tax=Paraflavisolibacter caeni TaxID=2982496 RepID=A0A9X3BH16_9BACT|nr:SusC/RagA family TonB-linked outer membrane protein [Paraflavisolibacter caeni]MCU7548782.1 SusC/RagA family TonB-linked outer membrane protein [Paraflavisolibacter caeni]